jgi:hypothetical protein
MIAKYGLNINGQHGRWVWTGTTRKKGLRAKFEVGKPGVTVFNIWMREAGTIIDRIVLTVDPKWRPGEAALKESPRAAASSGSSAKYKPGVYAEYFEIVAGVKRIPDLSKLERSLVRVHARLASHKWKWPGFNTRSKKRYAVRFTGFLLAPADDEYRFFLRSADGSKLWIDGKLLIDHDGIHGDKHKEAVVALKKGHVPVRLEYFQGGSKPLLQLSWTAKRLGKNIIPAGHFFHLPPTPGAVTLTPEADASASMYHVKQNFGTSHNLPVYAGGMRKNEAYLRFDLSGFKGTVGNASLVLHIKTPTNTKAVTHYCSLAASDKWDESTITWANKPARGRRVKALDISGKRKASFDITSSLSQALADGRKKITLVVSAGRNIKIDYASKEEDKKELRPALIITPAGSPGK